MAVIMTRYERIVAARNAGASWTAIADAFGITSDAARGIYSRHRNAKRHAAYIAARRSLYHGQRRSRKEDGAGLR